MPVQKRSSGGETIVYRSLIEWMQTQGCDAMDERSDCKSLAAMVRRKPTTTCDSRILAHAHTEENFVKSFGQDNAPVL